MNVYTEYMFRSIARRVPIFKCIYVVRRMCLSILSTALRGFMDNCTKVMSCT